MPIYKTKKRRSAPLLKVGSGRKTKSRLDLPILGGKGTKKPRHGIKEAVKLHNENTYSPRDRINSKTVSRSRGSRDYYGANDLELERVIRRETKKYTKKR